MTAEQLIKKLLKYPKATVRIWNDDIGTLNITVSEYAGENGEGVVIDICR